MIYQTWPLMNENYFPDDITFDKDLLLNLFNQASFVQFLHRNIAYFIVIYTFMILFFVFYNRQSYLYKPASYLGLSILIQALLGILTLISGVSMIFASLHQLSTIFLLISSIYFYYKSSI